jgi:hypothetical protein
MMSKTRTMVLMACVGMAAAASAQDSVGQRPGLANTDALRPHDVTEQCNSFVNDLTAITSSTNLVWGITPLVKTSRASANFPNNLVSSVAVSSTTRPVDATPVGTYLFWDSAGPGINQSLVGNPPLPANAPAQSTTGPSQSLQLAYVLTDFGTQSTNLSYNGLISGFINYNPSNPNRLLVTRTQTVVNGLAGENRSQLGIGSVDNFGNVAFRADRGALADQATTPPFLTGENYYRVATANRTCGALNILDNTGASDPGTTVWLLVRSAIGHNVPNIIPQGIAGRPILMGANFSAQYVYENAAGSLATTTAHRPGTTDHRGATGYTPFNFFSPSANGTGAVFSRPGSITTGISLWGLQADGGPGGTRLVTLPASITDGCSGFVETVTANHQFGHFFSQTRFRGNIPVAVGRDREGRLLAAGYVGEYLGAEDAAWPFGYIAGARLDTPAGAAQWGLAAYVHFDGASGTTVGKPFFDASGTQIGRLTVLSDVTGGAPLGPSMSAPAIDAAGNIWFLSAYVRTQSDGTVIPNSGNTGLFRAVYDGSNPAAPEWCLERVLVNGQVIHGANSDRDFKIIFIGIADSNSIGSDTLWANSVNQSTWAGAPANLDPADTRNLGGLVLACSLIYDVNQDGQFVSLTGQQGNPNSPDQNYTAMLFLAPFAQGGGKITDCNQNGVDDAADIKAGTSRDCFDYAAAAGTAGGANGVPDECECVADWNRDGVANSTDVSDFINTFFADQTSGALNGDVNCDGVSNSTDVSDFINIFFAAQAGQLPFAGCSI